MWVVPAHRRWVTTVADFVPQETLFWRRRIWERVGGQLDASLSFAMDWDLLLRFIAAEARIARLPRFLGAFRTHEEQKTVAIAAKGEREVEVLRERWHGYVMEPHEVYLRLRPFYRRQKALYLILRARERLPTRRITVMTARPLAAQPVHDKPYLTRNRETVAPR